MKKACRDALVIAAVGGIALLSFFLWRPEEATAQSAVVAVDGQGERTVSLLSDTVFTVTGNGGITLRIEVKDGAIRVAESGCPDHLCEQSGFLSHGGQAAVCVPAGVRVTVCGKNDAAVDGVTA